MNRPCLTVEQLIDKLKKMPGNALVHFGRVEVDEEVPVDEDIVYDEHFYYVEPEDNSFPVCCLLVEDHYEPDSEY